MHIKLPLCVGAGVGRVTHPAKSYLIIRNLYSITKLYLERWKSTRAQALVHLLRSVQVHICARMLACVYLEHVFVCLEVRPSSSCYWFTLLSSFFTASERVWGGLRQPDVWNSAFICDEVLPMNEWRLYSNWWLDFNDPTSMISYYLSPF